MVDGNSTVSEDSAADSGIPGTDAGAPADVAAQPARRRRRAASRPAGPPVVVDEQPGLWSSGESPDGAAEPAQAAEADTEVAHEPTASDSDVEGEFAAEQDVAAQEGGAGQDVAAEASPAEQDEAVEERPTDDAEAAHRAEEDSEAEVEVAADERADDDAAGQSEASGPAESPAEPTEPAEAAEATEPVAEQPVKEPGERRPRRATRGVTSVAFSGELTAAPVTETRTPPVEAPVVALFQPPDQTKAVRRRSRSRAEFAEATEAPPTELTEELVSLDDVVDETAEELEAGQGPEAVDEVEDDGTPRRRRRRGGRRRRRPGQGGPGSEGGDLEDSEDDAESATDTAEASGEPGAGEPEGSGAVQEAADEPDGGGESAGSRRRRRRRRRAGVAEEMEDLSTDEPSNTVVKVREGRRPTDEITSVRGSTRIEAKKQRRRDGREAGRRRAPILTEAEFLARRESVNRVMCVREHGDRTQIAVLEDGILVEHYVNRVESSSMVGNVYLGKVQNVLPSMEAAFVDIGRGRNAVLYAGEVNWEAAGLEGQPKRIELALKSGDAVLVQVTKDPIGHKGARLTSQISLPGRFLVYVPEGSMTGISRKLPDTERARLKGILKDVVPEGAGVIVRTAAEGASEEQLTADVTRLTAQWKDITKKAKSATAPSLLYGEPDLAIKVVRDIFNEDFTTLLVQGESTYRTLADYIGRVAPDLQGRVTLWVEPTELYSAHRIDEQLAKALDRKVWLPSGGSLVIDRTEAMTVVDVNTGKFTGQGGNLEETVTRNNLEAAEEIVRQLRLRDIGGIIVVDFIDMVLESNRDLVLRRLVECLGRDRTKHQVAEVTSLGLVQMTRKRIGQGLLEVFSTTCEACGGRGHIVSAEPVGAEESTEDRDRARRGNDRDRGGRRPKPAPVHLGGKQTGKTPPPPKFDEHGHIDHHEDGERPHEDAEHMDVEHVDVGHPHEDVEHVDAEHVDVEHVDVEHPHEDAEHVDAEHVDVEHVDVEHVDVEHVDAEPGQGDGGEVSEPPIEAAPEAAAQEGEAHQDHDLGAEAHVLPDAERADQHRHEAHDAEAV